MDLENEEFYNLNESLRGQVSHLIRDYSKLKNIIKSGETASRKLSENLSPLQSKISGLNSLTNNLLKSLTKSIANGVIGDGGGKQDFLSSIFKTFIGGARATGGNVAQGTPYIVGERGPEIFTPSSSGYISPNNAVSAKPINITMNINTPDIQGFQRSESQIAAQLARAMRKASKGF